MPRTDLRPEDFEMMTMDRAETVALGALGWLAAHEELLPVFMGASGATPDSLKASAGDPAFLTSVLDFVLMDDSWVLEMAAATGLDPKAPFVARQILAGPADMNWT